MPAPPGNKNAFEHGLYSKRTDPITFEAAGGVQTLSLEREVAVIRYVIEQILTSANDIHQRLRTWR